jgi:HSP20 family protein
MNLVRWNAQPRLSDIFDDIFEKNFYNNNWEKGNPPAANIVENEQEFRLEIAAPGFSRDDFKITLDKNILTVTSEKEAEQKDENYTRYEFSYGKFSRSFSLPKSVDTEGINAASENGILRITLPKKKEEILANVTREIAIA